MRRGAALALALIIIAFAACGKKGDPKPPPGEADVFPRVYPAPPTAPAPTSNQPKPAESGTPAAPTGTSDQAKPATPSPSP